MAAWTEKVPYLVKPMAESVQTLTDWRRRLEVVWNPSPQTTPAIRATPPYPAGPAWHLTVNLWSKLHSQCDVEVVTAAVQNYATSSRHASPACRYNFDLRRLAVLQDWFAGSTRRSWQHAAELAEGRARALTTGIQEGNTAFGRGSARLLAGCGVGRPPVTECLYSLPPGPKWKPLKLKPVAGPHEVQAPKRLGSGWRTFEKGPAAHRTSR